MFISPAYAADQTAQGGDLFSMLFLPLALFAIMYFFLIRPQQKRMIEHRRLIAGLKVKDKVVTSGGVVGKITKLINDDEVEIEIASSVKIRVMRQFVSTVVGPETIKKA